MVLIRIIAILYLYFNEQKGVVGLSTNNAGTEQMLNDNN